MSDEKLELIEPTEDFQDEFEAYRREFGDEGEIPGIGSMTPADDFAAGVRNCLDHGRGANLPEGWVPAHTFWLVRDGRSIVGMINLRHALTPFLESEGGHVGYSTRPSERGKGYATRMLAEVLEKARQLGLRRLLVTCDKENVASARVIQKNGGILRDEAPSVKPGGRWTQRYWIEL